METTIHRTSTKVQQTITSTLDDGRVTTLTSTSYVGVDPPQQTDRDESDPNLQDAAPNHRANVGAAFVVGGLVVGLLVV